MERDHRKVLAGITDQQRYWAGWSLGGLAPFLLGISLSAILHPRTDIRSSAESAHGRLNKQCVMVVNLLFEGGMAREEVGSKHESHDRRPLKHAG